MSCGQSTELGSSKLQNVSDVGMKAFGSPAMNKEQDSVHFVMRRFKRKSCISKQSVA